MNLLDMPPEATTRTFTVEGDRGSEFILYVLQNDTLKYYDFDDKSFELGHNNKHNNLKATLNQSSYSNTIKFPSGGGTYTIKLIASLGTEITTDKNKYAWFSIGNYEYEKYKYLWPGDILEGLDRYMEIVANLIKVTNENYNKF